MIRRVIGSSMLPTLRNGAIILAFKKKHIRVGDVVVARLEGREVVKRVQSILNDEYFLVGDNSAHSSDSRTKGAVQRADILARIVWPRISR